MVGVDEVGRGAWAGPLLVVAARQTGELPKGLKDSKQMTRMQRNSIFQILTSSFQFGEGWVSPLEIDNQGLASAMCLGVERALRAIEVQPSEELIMDGIVDYLPDFVKGTNPYKLEAKADNKYPVVSAASIYAKVARDNYMLELSLEFPGYGFDQHVGYGTKHHLESLIKLGPVRTVHRFCYKPVMKAALI